MNGQMDRQTLGYSYIYPKICLWVVSIFIYQHIYDDEDQKPVYMQVMNMIYQNCILFSSIQ